MSVINQVLNQLERRGAHAVLNQRMVRAVPPVRSHHPALLALAVLALAAPFVWLGWQAYDTAASRVGRIAPEVAMPVVRRPAADIVLVEEVPALSAVPIAPVAEEPLQPALLPGLELSEVPSPLDWSESKPVSATPQPAKQSARPPKVETRPLAAMPVVNDIPPLKQVSRAQQAEAEFRQGGALMQQGRSSEAIERYQAALALDGAHDAARQALVALLLEDKHGAEAERLLQERLLDRPQHTGFAMLLARLQVERGAAEEALATLDASSPFAAARADFLAFHAALLQRASRHAEAAERYRAALQLQPSHGTWLMGYGISLRALKRTDEAKAAFRQAIDSKALSPELQAFVQQQLNGL